jgi:hypothetical protein
MLILLLHNDVEQVLDFCDLATVGRRVVDNHFVADTLQAQAANRVALVLGASD